MIPTIEASAADFKFAKDAVKLLERGSSSQWSVPFHIGRAVSGVSEEGF
jgi:hypothetical protein